MSRPIDSQTKATIESAVDTLAKEFSGAQPSSSTRSRDHYLSFHSHRTGRYIALGVALFMIIIAGMWALNMSALFSRLSFDNTIDQELYASTESDVDALFNQLMTKEEASLAAQKADTRTDIESAIQTQALKTTLRSVLGTIVTSTTTTTLQ